MSTRARTAALAIAALGAAGCYTSWDIGPRQIPKLNGYRSPQRVELVSTRGEPFVYDPQSHLIFFEGPDRPTAVAVDDIRLDGPILRGIERNEGRPFAIDLRGVSLVRVKQLSQGKTFGLILGATAGAAVVVGVVVLAASLQSWSNSWKSSGCKTLSCD